MEKLKKRLQTLPDKLTHPTQVPVGVQTPGSPPLVLLNGYLKHTNEILVLLGDNWFVQRSAKQAIDILERRMSKTRQMIEDFEKEKSSHEKWMATVRQMQQESGNLVDLQEQFDEEAEKRWREQHRAKVRAEKVREREERMQNRDQNDDELERRMQQLEMQEQREQAALNDVVSERRIPLSPAAPTPQQPPTALPAARVSKFAASRRQR